MSCHFFRQRDSNLARMLFSSLYCSLFGLVERELEEEEGETAVAAIRDGLNAVLTHSTDYDPPFIGSLHVSKTWRRIYGVMRRWSDIL